jgi:hypothetical protein
MSDTSRRKFLAVASAGAAAGTVGLVAGPASGAQSPLTSKSAKEGVVALVADHTSSEVSLMVGDREVVVHDRELVRRILNAAGAE